MLVFLDALPKKENCEQVLIKMAFPIYLKSYFIPKCIRHRRLMNDYDSNILLLKMDMGFLLVILIKY